MTTNQETESIVAARRRFLATCGRFAVVTPPAVTLMLVASKQSFAVAVSGSHGGGHHGRPHWGHDYHPHRKRHADHGHSYGGREHGPGRQNHSHGAR